MSNPERITIFGSGPAGLMAATQLILGLNHAGQGSRFQVQIADRRKGFGRKLLIAGSSGLNISHHLAIQSFAAHYQGWSVAMWESWLNRFGCREWLNWIHSLGLETFLGTSDRYFVREMKASTLLKKWTQWLESQGVVFLPATEFDSDAGNVELESSVGVVLALGGGSWETEPVTWPESLTKKWSVQTRPFTPANVGFEVVWSPAFLKEAEGKPLKNIIFKSALGEKSGELMVTQYGLEGTPIYFFGTPGVAEIDLKPAWTEAEILERLTATRENWSPVRRAQKKLGLSDVAQALLFHHAPRESLQDLQKLASVIKRFPMELLRPRPLSEAISSRGGIELQEVEILSGNEFLLKKPSEILKKPIFAVGEMLNWTAPTGGFLIQAAVTQGALAGQNLARRLTTW
jgi:uncharacterized flavoprotein (TIGR03862 family)